MSNPKFRILAGASAIAFAFTLSACGETEEAPPPAEAAPMADAMPAENTTMVGGAAMYPDKTIVENAAAAPNLSTLVTAVQAAELAETLSGPGPFTVFAPTNDAFGKLPAGTVEELTQPANKDQLTKILTYHVVSGEMTSADLAAAIEAGGGTATLTTVQGGELKATMANGGIQLMDAAGGTAMVTTADVDQSNGVVHVIDTVVMPAA